MVALVAMTSCAGGPTNRRATTADQTGFRVTTNAEPPATDLVFQKSANYYKAAPSRTSEAHLLARVSQGEVLAVAIDKDRLYWAASYTGNPIYMTKRAHPRDRHLLVKHAGLVVGLSTVKGYLYWANTSYVGRMSLADRTVERHYLRLPAQTHGDTDAADGMTVAGTDLYFSQCTENRIGRVSLLAHDNSPAVTWVVQDAPCPQALAADRGHLYWDGSTLSGEAIGRATLSGRQVDTNWFPLRRSSPTSMVSDGAYLYWVWTVSQPPPTPSFIARIRSSNGTSYDPRFRRVKGGAITVAASTD
jgi:hypothetical protein